MTTELRVTAMDHIVLKCRDIEATLAWYLGELGLSPVRIDEWRAGDAPFPSVRVSADTIIDLVAVPADQDPKNDRLDHVCLVIEPTGLDALAASGRFDVVGGPGRRYGARGNGTSLYVRDPDGTVVELRHY